MARLDVRRLTQVRGVALVVEMQAELLADIKTAIVAPLVPVRQLPPIAEVNPVITFDGQKMALRLEQLISIPRSRLGNKVGSMLGEEYQIMRALDRLLSRT
jgi:toxin CcdB